MSRIVFVLMLFSVAGAAAQPDATRQGPRGFRVAGLPNLNYNSDEGFGYGARLSLYNHAEGGYTPYYYLVDANLFLTTGGRSEIFLFFDAPHLFARSGRLTAQVQYAHYDAAPFYGIGDGARYDEDRVDPEAAAFISEDYYAFERTRATLWGVYQHRLGPAFRVLAGLGLVHTGVGQAGGPTLLGERGAEGEDGGFTNYVRLGLIHDTRDFEPAPSSGDWSDVLLELSTGVLGSDYDYARLTLTNRHYWTVLPRLVLAERIVYETAWGAMPFYEMGFFGSSFRVQEAVGGAKSVRGLLQSRYIGPTKLFGNVELRWRALDFGLLGQDFYLALSAFVDYGRVWDDPATVSLDGFHSGQGGGLHIGWNETFIVTVDAARSVEVPLALYIGIGYLF